MRIRFPIVLLALVIPVAHAAAQTAGGTPDPGGAKQRSRPGWSLDRTMREFLHAIAPNGFFPARGAWTWVETRHRDGAPDLAGVWRFSAAQTDSALGTWGPVCDVFGAGDAVMTGSIAEASSYGATWPWRRVHGTRYVPPGRPARSPVYVQWRREDGRWVVDSFGTEAEYYVPFVGARNPIRRPRGPLTLPLPPLAHVASDADWYRQNLPIRVDDRLMTKYGVPRLLAERDLQRWSTYEGVDVYAERGFDTPRPVVLYLPVDRDGSFQPYMYIGNGCLD